MVVVPVYVLLPAKVRAPAPLLVIEIGPEMAPLRARVLVPDNVSVEAVRAEMPPAMIPPSWLMVVAPPRVIGAVRVAPGKTRRAPRPSPLPVPTRLSPARVWEAATMRVLPESTEMVAPVPVKPVVLSLLEVEVPLTWMVPVKPVRLPVR